MVRGRSCIVHYQSRRDDRSHRYKFRISAPKEDRN